ncbi:hypothetical protein CHS0354_039104, partial [Potamilus streckersoni]
FVIVFTTEIFFDMIEVDDVHFSKEDDYTTFSSGYDSSPAGGTGSSTSSAAYALVPSRVINDFCGTIFGRDITSMVLSKSL